MGEDYNTKCGVKLNYQSIGSGGGIKQWTNNTVDFGASDAYLKDSEIQAAAANGEPVEIPVTFGAVVVAYNLQGLSAPIQMTPDVVAGIFLGTITKWNDPAIAAQNAGVSLPDTDISVVHRSDGSGTTSIFTTYLSAVSPDWVTTVGGGDTTKSAGKEVEWPTGLGASGNEGVTQGINQTDGGVGYIELAYALKNNIPFATLQNKSGNFIVPSLDSVKAAADLPSYPGDLRFDLTNTDAAQGYPITGTTWIIVYKDLSKVLKSQDRANALVDFLWWAIHDGQTDTAPLFYGADPGKPARPGRGHRQVAELERNRRSCRDRLIPGRAATRELGPGWLLGILGGIVTTGPQAPRHSRVATALRPQPGRLVPAGAAGRGHPGRGARPVDDGRHVLPRPSRSGSGSASRASSPGLRWAPSFTIYGALPFIYGTLLTSAIAMLIAVPVAVLIALLITEILPPRARSTVAVTVDLLAAIPSVVYGLWGLLVLVPFLRPFEQAVAGTLGKVVPVPGRADTRAELLRGGRRRLDHDHPDHRGPQPRGVRGHAPPAA